MRVFLYESLSAIGGSASLQDEGWGMLSAIVEDFQRLPEIETHTLLDERLPAAIGHVCTRCTRANEHARFRELAAASDWTLVIAPEFGDQLHNRSQEVLDVGGRLLGSMPDAIRLTGDKLATAEHWRANGIAHPRTELASRRRVPSFPHPWVIKPRNGAGAEATVLVAGDVELAWPDWEFGDFIVQPFAPGEPVSVAFLIGANRTIALTPARQHIEYDRLGRIRYQGGSLPLPQPLADRAIACATKAIARIPGLRGYVGVDLVLGEQDWAIEINPRLTTSYLGLRQTSNTNLAELILHCANGDAIVSPVWKENEVRFGTGERRGVSPP